MSKTKLTLAMPDEELVIAAKQKALTMRVSLSEAVAALLQGWLDASTALLRGTPDTEAAANLRAWAIQVAQALGIDGDPVPDLSLAVPVAQRLAGERDALLAENTAQFHRISALEAQIAATPAAASAAAAQEFTEIVGVTPLAGPPQPTAVPGDGIQCTVNTPHNAAQCNAAQCNGAHLPLSPNGT
jgi:hypothetical protein